MSQIRRILRILSKPHLIPTKIEEKRMVAAYRRMISERTETINDAERLTFFAAASPRHQVAAMVTEAQQTTTYQRLVDSRTTDTPENRIINSATTSLDDCVTMYVLVRVWKPQVMVETGVFYGALSAMIIHAMQRNGGGKLYSIDLPVEADELPDSMRGGLVSGSLRDHWELILGDSKIELPRLLARLGKIDAFNHDSLHTTDHMSWEYQTAWPVIKPGGVISSHDIMLTPAWKRFCRRHQTEIDYRGQVYGLGIAHKRA
jgi:predicted O-methyltransferase YrrM